VFWSSVIELPPDALCLSCCDWSTLAELLPVSECWPTTAVCRPSCCSVIEPPPILSDCDAFRSWLTLALFDPSSFHWPISAHCSTYCVIPDPAATCCSTWARFAPVVFTWKILQLCVPVGSPIFSLHVALLSVPVDDWTIRQSFGDVADPSSDGVHSNLLFTPLICRTRLAVVQVHRTPGQLGPA
jgi:hypothetical protein